MVSLPGRGCSNPNGDSWDRMLQQGIQLLDRFAQDDRVRIRQPRRNLQIKFSASGRCKNEFVAYVDAIGKLDGTGCLLEWKTTSSRYPEEPEGLLALDPQLVCYSWMTGISDVAQIVFVRKRLVEIQYLRTTITDEQRAEFGRLVEDTSAASNPPSSCPTAASASPRIPAPAVPIGLCLGKPRLVESLSSGGQEQRTLVGLTSLLTRNPPMPPKLNRKRAQFVLTKIDEILAWEKRNEAERDTRFVELGGICARCGRGSTGGWRI